jgi:N,N'-diacetyllegionaminate synthase
VPFLRYLARLGVPLIFSTGASTQEELDAAMTALLAETSQLIVLHCVSSYPAPLDQLNLRLIPALRERYGVPVGFSDHALGAEAASAAVALGARVFEKHFTLDRNQAGPDHQASASPDELRHYVGVLRAIHRGLGTGVKEVQHTEQDTRVAFRRFLVAARPIARGAVVSADDFVFKKIANGIPPADLDKIVGLVAATDIPLDAAIEWSHVEQPSEHR